jgi:hypothetical protein
LIALNVSGGFNDTVITFGRQITGGFEDSALTIDTNSSITWLNLTSWGPSHSLWRIYATGSPGITFTLSGLESGRMYRLYIDGDPSNLLTASGSGVVSFTYSGPWSEHQFEIVATSITGNISPLVNLIFLTFAIGVVVGVIAEGTKPIRNGEMLTAQESTKMLLNMVIYIIIGIAALGIMYSMV